MIQTAPALAAGTRKNITQEHADELFRETGLSHLCEDENHDEEEGLFRFHLEDTRTVVITGDGAVRIYDALDD